MSWAVCATDLANSERVRAAVAAHPFKFETTSLPVTVSIGVARAPGAGMSASGDLVARADEAMYAAKRGGRNRVCVDESEVAAGQSDPAEPTKPST